ncbi:MAG: flagellar protein [Alkaliphilus sp.]|nr:flagellar FlbD family protein [Alkaliphilus transvaalensis]PHS35250.1 MAG: flagellar protein [Alkaliphilus sp.]
MITLKRLNDEEFLLNSDLIEFIDQTPDTIITLMNGHKYVVLEKTEEILEKIKKYKKDIYLGKHLQDDNF